MNMFKCPGLSLNFTLKSRSRSAPPSTLDPSSPERQIYRSALTLIPHPRRAHLCWAEEQEEYTSAGSIDLPLPPVTCAGRKSRKNTRPPEFISTICSRWPPPLSPVPCCIHTQV